MLIRLLLADGEELAEGGVDELLQAMAPALRGYGVVLEGLKVHRSHVRSVLNMALHRRCRAWETGSDVAVTEQTLCSGEPAAAT